MLITEAAGHVGGVIRARDLWCHAGRQEVSNLRVLMQWPCTGSQEVGGHSSAPFHPFSLTLLQTKRNQGPRRSDHSRSGARTVRNEPGTFRCGQKTRKLFKVNGVMANDTDNIQVWRGGPPTLHRGDNLILPKRILTAMD